MRLLLATLLLPLAGHAQVATDDHALDSLPAAREVPAAKVVPVRPRTHRAIHPATAVAPRLPPVAIPPGPPAHPVVAPPPFVMPAHPAPPPPSVTVKADAAGSASGIEGGTRVTFGAGVADLNPATLAAIQAIAAHAVANPALTIGVDAWAPGTQDDPSAPRRLSLDRALAVRAVLIKAGVASERIRAVAKGMAGIGASPADRADVLELTVGR